MLPVPLAGVELDDPLPLVPFVPVLEVVPLLLPDEPELPVPLLVVLEAGVFGTATAGRLGRMRPAPLGS